MTKERSAIISTSYSIATLLKARCIDLEMLKKELKEEFLREIRGVNIANAPASCYTSIFNEAIMATPFFDNFMTSSIVSYDEKGNLAAYVDVFYA